MDKTWYLDSFNGILNPISAVRTMCDSIRTNARRDGMGAIEDSGRKLYELCNDMEHQIRATINLMNFSKDHGITSSTVYSDSFDEMIQKEFTYKGNKYTWNDSDCVYYNDNGDEDDYFMEIPEGAITSSKNSIKSSYDKETLKKVIRAYLDKMGYKDVEGGVDAAADYIWQNEDYYTDYDLHSKVKQWFKETKENYPETLIKASRDDNEITILNRDDKLVIKVSLKDDIKRIRGEQAANVIFARLQGDNKFMQMLDNLVHNDKEVVCIVYDPDTNERIASINF